MTQKHGRRFELSLVNDVDEITPEEVWTTTVGYSGSANADGCDIVVTIDPQILTYDDVVQYNIEAKKRQAEGGKRHSSVFGGSEKDETGVEELRRLVLTTPPWADPIVSLKFDHRRLIVLDARWILDHVGEGDYQDILFGAARTLLEIVQPRTTPSDNISMVKPSLDDWPSAQAAEDDAVVLAEKLGLPYDDD